MHLKRPFHFYRDPIFYLGLLLLLPTINHFEMFDLIGLVLGIGCLVKAFFTPKQKA
ncbi:hypothetical protein [Lactiplantibacillus mudanjiangensis]|uniref:Uncharacterized protein n=1 Tax=Lactiplantibacillus mudanjiangensis TaxID=1296538 RepID=A0A660E747_9LACO|nr:hypothetical protein [Lactiplantibacillus mudanjiangensis]VDG19723.1 hypothetical protein MUDAN_BIHEEGNE_01452 [Lactiplantibacillus mudanjiangensis]VDG24397.1 hypothetical protein MUDAN_IGPPGNFN_02642 [Lactiplantibacillus mudanjiangensis]VDG28199.1 hypothetical protein MUDAN_MDHGFNIF_02921 [Lactiplantibacillus mudanjiangensis]VDG31155.1 hypothetical protein MUDAN_DOGOELCO_00656 [Lactiplantibacillus mudanjiangensis]